jgi:hypothetical protein
MSRDSGEVDGEGCGDGAGWSFAVWLRGFAEAAGGAVWAEGRERWLREIGSPAWMEISGDAGSFTLFSQPTRGLYSWHPRSFFDL